MPAARSRKRAASQELVADSVVPKKPRQTKKSQAEVRLKSKVGDDEPKASDPTKAPLSKESDKKSKTTNSKGTQVKGKNSKKAKDQEDEVDAGDDADADAEKKVEPKQESEFKAHDLLIPVDEELQLSNQYYVYIDEDRTIYDASLNQTNTAGNSNKFYKIQLGFDGNGKFWTWTRYGRIGDRGRKEQLGSGSLSDARWYFELKFKEKTGLKWEERLNDPKPKKYVFLERTYEAESDDDGTVKSEDKPTPESTLAPEVQSLMKFVFNQDYITGTMADIKYDVIKLPLGKLSKSTILRGYQALKDLGALFDDHGLAELFHNTDYQGAVESLSNRYYSYIPHAFGRNRPPLIETLDLLKREIQLLENLTDLKDSDDIMRPERRKKINMLDARYKGLGLRELTPVDQSSAEFSNIHEYLTKTRGSTHGFNYKLLQVYRLEREGEGTRFKKLDKDKSDRRLLWHGSRSTNFGGILSQGLRIAPSEAPVNGYMFGKGVYLADMSSKSAGYCCHHISNNEGLLLLCEAELGTPIQELTVSSYTAGEDALSQNLLSTWGKGQTGPKAWKDAGCIHPDLKGVKMPDTTDIPGITNVKHPSLYYNEYVCYDVAQIRLRYLLHVRMG